MKKATFFLFFIWIFLLPVLADYSVDSVAVSAEVSATGKTQVTTVLQLTFDTATTELTIPLPESSVSKVSVSNYKAKTRKDSGGVDLIITSQSGFLGTQTFVVSYTVALGSSDFSMGLLSSRWARGIASCSYQIVMPAGFTETPEIVSGYYGALSEADAGLTTTETTISGTVTDLMAYDTLTVTLELDENYFGEQKDWTENITPTYLAGLMLLLWLLIILYWWRCIRTKHPEATPRLLPPAGILTCQLPMVLDGSTCDIGAMLLEWGNLGYLAVSISKNGRVILTRRMAMGSERSRAEQKLFAGIFGRRTRVVATPGRFAAVGARFRAASRKSLYRVIFDRAGGNPSLVQLPSCFLLAVGIGYMVARALPEGGVYLILVIPAGVVGMIYALMLHDAFSRCGVLRMVSVRSVVCWVLLVGLLLLSLFVGALPELLVGGAACCFSGLATAQGPRRSQRGIDAMTQTRGCRTFYCQGAYSRMEAFQAKYTRFFQLQFPRAAALRVDRRFARRFGGLLVPVPEWLKLVDTSPRSAVTLQKQLSVILQALREAFEQ